MQRMSTWSGLIIENGATPEELDYGGRSLEVCFLGVGFIIETDADKHEINPCLTFGTPRGWHLVPSSSSSAYASTQ